MRIDRRRWIIAGLAAVLAACGQTSPAAHLSSPSPSFSQPAGNSPSASPSATADKSPATPTPTPATSGVRLVIQDYGKNQVRLARLDAVDVATVPGSFDAVVDGRVIVVNGQNLLAVAANGSVSTLGHLAGAPEWNGPQTVAVKPDLSQWLYTIVDFTNLTSKIHLGSPSTDRLIATIPSPDGTAFYNPYAWNASGAYLVREGTGLGGVGPFLEYHFPLVRLDVATGQIAAVTPLCIAEAVLGDGTMLCSTSTRGLEVCAPGGGSHVIQVATATTPGVGVYSRLTLSPDQTRFVVARNGNANPALVNYQMATGELSGSTASTFGPADFRPDVWLPDGRIVATHLCWTFQQNGGPCNQALDATYFVSGDGSSTTLFFKLADSAFIVRVL